MNLSPMRYRSYTWPHNPRVYSIDYHRTLAVHKLPFGLYQLQDLGRTNRVMKGEGEFVGEGAYQEFKKLASVFYEDGPGLLIHPLWQISNAYFTALKLEQEPLPDYVRYSFEFRERFDGYGEELTEVSRNGAGSPVRRAETPEVRHTVASGDTLWGIARQYNVALEDLLAVNSGIKNPNFIRLGDQVVVPC